ncbi:MAG: hypothetical protein A2133_04165 [Actinobacteria bacterium RBG_16_64_13]|nr:MAG: hypothetical protein A2133_04165 [Actinobacteria bacterium RBG_16_64_13]
MEDSLGLTLISVAVGLALAVAYHLLSSRLQSLVANRSSAMVPVVTILGFLVRLAVLAAILVILGLWTSLNMLAVCAAFVVVFTALTGFSVYSMLSKRHGAPPSAGATGAH